MSNIYTPLSIADENYPRLDKDKILLHPDSALPDGHERDTKEKAEDAANLKKGKIFICKKKIPPN